jgi:hypothetical protein
MRGLLALAAVLTSVPAFRQDAPPEAEIAAQQQAVRTLYKSEYAAKDPAKRRQLAQRLLQFSASGTDAERIAMLREAAQVAARAGDLDTARGACDTLVSGWKVDAAAERLALYQAAAGASVEQAVAAASDLLAAADAAADADNFAGARKLAEAAAKYARLGRDEALAQQAMASAGKARDLGAEFARAGGSDLSGDRSPAARAALGRFYALSKGDWGRALPLLAEGDDEALKAAAAADLAAKSADEREQAGEQWAELARKASARHRPPLYRRALDNLIRAADGATGLVKVRLDKRVAELEPLAGKPRGSVASAPPGVLFWLDGEPGPDGKGIVDTGPFGLKPEVAGKVLLLREGHGGYLRFDGSGGVTVPLKTPVPATSSISVALWARNTDKQERSGLIGIGQGGNILVHPNGGTIVFLDLAVKSPLPQANLGEPGHGVWRHLAFVLDALKKESFLYFDGDQAQRAPGPTSPLAEAIDAVQVGTSRWGPIIGDLDSIGFWGRALNPDEVKALYAAGKNGRGR